VITGDTKRVLHCYEDLKRAIGAIYTSCVTDIKEV